MKKLFATLTILCSSFLLFNIPVHAENSSTVEPTQQTINPIQKEVTFEETTNDDILEVSVQDFYVNTVNGDHLYFFEEMFSQTGYEKITINKTKGYIDLVSPRNQTKWVFKDITFKGDVYQPGDRIYDEDIKNTDFLNKTELQNFGLYYNYEPTEDFYVNFSYSFYDENTHQFTTFSEEFITEHNLQKKLGPFPGQVSLTLEAPEIPGYKCDSALIYMPPSIGFLNIETNPEYTFTNGTPRNGTTYLYKKVDVEGAPVTIKYVDIDGNPVSPDTLLTGLNGATYSTQPKEIDGYRLINVLGTENGSFNLEAQTITYTYEKIPVIPPYIDYQANTIVSISDLERTLEISKNYNVLLLTQEKDNTLFIGAGTTQGLNLLNKQVTTSKRIQTANGNVYYSIIEGNKEYVILSTAFKNVTNVLEDDLSLYYGVNLDYKGNYLTSFNNISQKVTLVNNYNVYDLLKTGGDGFINPNSGTSSSLNLINQSFDVTREYTTSGGSKFYNIIVDGYNYFINATAFIVETIQALSK